MDKSIEFLYAPVFTAEADGNLLFLEIWINKKIIFIAIGVLTALIILIFNENITLAIILSIIFAFLLSPLSLKYMLHAQNKKSLALYEKSAAKIHIMFDHEKVLYEYGMRKSTIYFKERPRAIQVKKDFFIIYRGFNYIVISLNSLPSKLSAISAIVAILEENDVKIECVGLCE